MEPPFTAELSTFNKLIVHSEVFKLSKLAWVSRLAGGYLTSFCFPFAKLIYGKEDGNGPVIPVIPSLLLIIVAETFSTPALAPDTVPKY